MMHCTSSKLPFKIVIPARYSSTRLPGKPLLQLGGKPMLQHVWERAIKAGADQVVVATDDQRIFECVQALGGEVRMTGGHHQSGTERIAEVAALCAWQDDDIVVNLQGDEPLIPGEYIRLLAEALHADPSLGIATLACAIHDSQELFNPNAVKVVLNNLGNALYFSRAPIPWDRNSFANAEQCLSKLQPHYRHIGMYAYRVGFLRRYCQWQTSVLEQVECLEQLRILWYGEVVRVSIVDQAPPAGVDTPEDIQRVERILAAGDY